MSEKDIAEIVNATIKAQQGSFWYRYGKWILTSILIPVLTVYGTFRVMQYRMDRMETKNDNQDISIFELQMNTITIADKTDVLLPYKYSGYSRGGNLSSIYIPNINEINTANIFNDIYKIYMQN
jgi:hypothetical protein